MNLSEEKLVNTISSKNIEHQKINLDTYSLCTFIWDHQPSIVIFPKNEEEISFVVREINKNNLKYKAISKGYNWGFGSACSGPKESIIIDLSQMNKIKEFRDDIGLISLQPGVTYNQLYEYLSKLDHPYWIDPNGASGESSILGNLLQRGHGLTPYGDHIRHLISLKAILKDGTKINTNPINNDPLPFGPDQKGLFSQSSYGIVYEVKIELMPKPKTMSVIEIKFCEASLTSIIDKTLILKRNNFFSSTLLLANDYRQLLSVVPLEEPLDSKDIKTEKQKYGIDDWSCFFSLYEESEGILNEKISYLKKHFKNISFYRNSIETSNNYAASCVKLFSGVPQKESKRLYRKKIFNKQILKTDYDKDRCGFYWITATIDALGKEVLKIKEVVLNHLLKFNITPEFNYFAKRSRVIHVHIGIHFDLNEKQNSIKAKEAYTSLKKILIHYGFFPHRDGIQDITEQ